jgi:hypothetical protein
MANKVEDCLQDLRYSIIYIYPKESVGFWLQRPTPQLLVEKKESKRGEE